MKVKLDTTELKAFVENLRKEFNDKERKMPEFWKRVTLYLYRVEDEIFRAKGAYGGAPAWAPLKASTLRARWYRRNKGKSLVVKGGKSRAGAVGFMQSARPLEDTGMLRASVGVLASEAKRLDFGSKLNYAAAQQKGTRHTPARKYLFLTKQDFDHIEQMALNYFGFGKKDGGNIAHE